MKFIINDIEKLVLPIIIYIVVYFIITKALKIMLRTKDKNYKKEKLYIDF